MCARQKASSYVVQSFTSRIYDITFSYFSYICDLDSSFVNVLVSVVRRHLACEVHCRRCEELSRVSLLICFIIIIIIIGITIYNIYSLLFQIFLFFFINNIHFSRQYLLFRV